MCSMPADLVIRNVVPFRHGRFGREPVSVVVDGGRIVAIRRHCAGECAENGAVVLEGRGGALVPGLVDAHLHLVETALSRLWLDLRGVGSIEELKELVARRAERMPKGSWILGRGWDQDEFREKRYPSAGDLDEAAPENPVLLIRVCGHVAVANSLALERAGIDARTPDPPGGTIERATLLLRRRGARAVYAACVHPLLVKGALERVRGAGCLGLVGTNTVPSEISKVDVTPLIAGALRGECATL